MRRGDFSVEIVPVHADHVRELDSGHVLARPGAVYAVRLRNLGPLRAVCQLEIDGTSVTAGGLVLNAYATTTLERPIDDGETGRFTVFAEGDERVFGPDGGRDNPQLGSISASFKREFPSRGHDDRTSFDYPSLWRDLPTPERVRSRDAPPDISAISQLSTRESEPSTFAHRSDAIERAAGTGLTGHSSQRFEPITLGPLEDEATVIQLRLVIGTEEALAAPRPLPSDADQAPARPAARP